MSESAAKVVVEYIGDAPTNCDLCQRRIAQTFIDGPTAYGSWANMCRVCHKAKGRGLGKGRGQQFQQVDGRWIKTAG